MAKKPHWEYKKYKLAFLTHNGESLNTRAGAMGKKRLQKVLPASALFLAGLLTITWSCTQKEPIKIGLAINLSGQNGATGEDIRDGALLAMDQINHTGGINGKRLIIITKNDKGTREGIIDADKDLIDKGCIAIIGHSYSEDTMIAYPYVTSRGVILFSPYTATSELSGKDDLFIRTVPDTRAYGRAIANLLSKRRADKAAFLLAPSNKSFCEDMFHETKKYFKGAAVPVWFRPGPDDSLGEAVKELIKTGADAIILVTDEVSTGIAAQKLRNAGFRGGLIGTIWAQGPTMLQYGGKAVEGMTIISPTYPDKDSKAFLDFSAALGKRFNIKPSSKSLRAYEAVYILSEALKKCPKRGAISPSGLKAALLGNEFKGVLGTVRFDKYGDVIRPIYEIQVQNGRGIKKSELSWPEK